MFFTVLIICLSALLLAHSIFNLLSMIYSWNDPYSLDQRKSPKQFLPPKFTFSLLLPVRNEPAVIADTLSAMSQISYPQDMFEVLVLCRCDDQVTLDVIKQWLATSKRQNIKLIEVNSDTDNKPKALNIGLRHSKNEIITVFDAEDEPHTDILNVINTVMIRTGSDVIQSGVQLMNHNSNWFSAFNVLEYYFWFKSTLHFYSSLGVVPLGGNTVFIRRDILTKVGGWNASILTEDADLGIRLSAKNAKITIVYDEEHVTREETPATAFQFVKQRTRWNQGFLQIFFDFSWLKLKGIRRKLLTAYVLFTPIIQGLWILYLPLTVIANITLQLPIGWALFSLLPAYVMFIQFILLNYGMFEFTRDYHYKYSPTLILKLIITFLPYQILLSTSALRATMRLAFGHAEWEKTVHINEHRLATNAS